jgi:hypothetical protein
MIPVVALGDHASAMGMTRARQYSFRRFHLTALDRLTLFQGSYQQRQVVGILKAEGVEEPYLEAASQELVYRGWLRLEGSSRSELPLRR